MKKYLKELVDSCIVETVKELEENYPVKVLAGIVGASTAMGLRDEKRDIDLYFLAEFQNTEERFFIKYKKDITINNKEYQLDINIWDYKDIFDKSDIYSKQQKHYPTILYRTKEEQQKWNIICKEQRSWQRSDFWMEFLYMFWQADDIWIFKENEMMANLMEKVQEDDIIDFKLIRAYGNKNNFLNQKKVKARKYLNTLHEIYYCRWLIEKKEKPPVEFDLLFQAFEKEDVWIKHMIEDLLNANQKGEEVEKNQGLNLYIKDNIDKLLNQLKEK